MLPITFAVMAGRLWILKMFSRIRQECYKSTMLLHCSCHQKVQGHSSFTHHPCATVFHRLAKHYGLRSVTAHLCCQAALNQKIMWPRELCIMSSVALNALVFVNGLAMGLRTVA